MRSIFGSRDHAPCESRDRVPGKKETFKIAKTTLARHKNVMANPEIYSPRYGKNLISDYQTRSANKEALFFIPYLHAGMNLLDCGCGPGTITADLAKVVTPGEIVGIDVSSEQIKLASAFSRKNNLPNIKFQVADVYQLPFPDKVFDGVFAHTILQHLKNPVLALEEIYRVLKPGGIVGVRDDDRSSLILSPYSLQMERVVALLSKYMQHCGGNPYIGKQHKALLRQAGFSNIKASASCNYHGESETINQYSKVIVELLRGPVRQRAIQEGWITKNEIQQLIDKCLNWSKDPDAFDAIIFCEAVAWKK